MLEHMFADQKIGRRKIQFEKIPSEELDIFLCKSLFVPSDDGLDDVVSLVVDATPIKCLRKLPIAASSIHHGTNLVGLQKLLQKRTIDQSGADHRSRPGGSGTLRVFSPRRVTIDIRERLLRRRALGGDTRGDPSFRIGWD